MAYALKNVHGWRENLNDVGSPVFYIRDICNQFFALGWTINVFSHIMRKVSGLQHVLSGSLGSTLEYLSFGYIKGFFRCPSSLDGKSPLHYRKFFFYLSCSVVSDGQVTWEWVSQYSDGTMPEGRVGLWDRLGLYSSFAGGSCRTTFVQSLMLRLYA